MLRDPLEREIAQLEYDLERAEDDHDQSEIKALKIALRELNREARDRDSWEDEGKREGWL